MLSLSKLTRLASPSLSLSTISSEPVQRALENVDDALDLVNSQQSLLSAFERYLSGSEATMGVEEKGEVVAERVCTSLEERGAMAQVRRRLLLFSVCSRLLPPKESANGSSVSSYDAQLYAKLTARLFAGQSLSAEDLIDLYTLKENTRENAGDFATALEVLVRAKVRRSAYLSPRLPFSPERMKLMRTAPTAGPPRSEKEGRSREHLEEDLHPG